MSGDKSDVKEAAEIDWDALNPEPYTPEGGHRVGFCRGAAWQLAQLRCETCRHYCNDLANQHCHNKAVLRQLYCGGDGGPPELLADDDYGCILWEGKE